MRWPSPSVIATEFIQRRNCIHFFTKYATQAGLVNRSSCISARGAGCRRSSSLRYVIAPGLVEIRSCTHFSQNTVLGQDWLTILSAFQLRGRILLIRLPVLCYCYRISWELRAGSVMRWPSPCVTATGFIERRNCTHFSQNTALRQDWLCYSYRISRKKKPHPFFTKYSAQCVSAWGQEELLQLPALHYCYRISWELQAGSVMHWPSPSVVATGLVERRNCIPFSTKCIPFSTKYTA